MNWKLLAIIAGVAGIASVIASSVEAKTGNGDGGPVSKRKLERMRSEVREYFEVSGDCSIAYVGDPADAAEFWQNFTPYLQEMIRLAALALVRDAPGVAGFAMLNLFPECDPTQEQTLSFKAVRATLEVRIRALMGL